LQTEGSSPGALLDFMNGKRAPKHALARAFRSRNPKARLAMNLLFAI